MPPVDTDELTENVRLIPIHQGLARAFFWGPVFVLFTVARFDLDGALLLASLYYLFVVTLEVPSGWMSDRLGRVFTLRIAAVCWIGAQLCFLVGDDRFVVIVAGQFLLAAGFASLSGTDVTFHYDTLEALGRAATYADRQSRVSAVGYAVTAVSSLVGGALGLIDLRWAFAASLVAAVVQLAVTLRFHEPPSTDHADPFRRQLTTCMSLIRGRLLGWLFFYGVILVTHEHVAHTLMQPWLAEVLDRDLDDLGATPLLAGALAALVAVVGSGAARASAPLGRRFGFVAVLIGFSVLSAVIVSAMWLSIHVAVIALAAFRSAQGAAAPVLITATAAPRIERHQRATFLSLNSLAGRLGYGVILLIISGRAGEDLQAALGVLSGLSWVMVVVLIASAVAVRPAIATAGGSGAAG